MIENLHRLLNRSKADRRAAERDGNLARRQTILDRNKITALQAENDALRAELAAMAARSRSCRRGSPLCHSRPNLTAVLSHYRLLANVIRAARTTEPRMASACR
jgi:hypothetical protein